ncbi:MAG: formyl transferase [Clostridiales bacterium]|nr:formyl transferase [Clostridiales bacterium]
MLAGDSHSSDIVYNCLNREFGVDFVIMEHGVDRKTFLKKRIKRLGIFKVIGQILFTVFIVRKLEKSSKDRIAEILQENQLNNDRSYREGDKFQFVKTVNGEETADLLKKLKPDVIIVNGTRIIKKHILDIGDAPFINMHTGITPKYRGVHGGYWALVNHDEENCGVTVHLVDEGIDTGSILYQERIHPTERDNFVTYPYLQTSEGVKLEIKALYDLQQGELHPCSNDLPSHLWTHPTLLEYIRHKVK